MSKRRFSGVVCCVVNCRNKQSNTKNISFYSFSTKPHKAEQREKWIKAVRRINADGSLWQPNKYTKICSAHFIDNVKSEHPLSPSFVPTIFPPCYLNSNPSEKSILNAKRRFQKCLAAGINKAIIPKSIKRSEAATTSEYFYEPKLKSPSENEGTVEVLSQKYVEIAHTEMTALPERNEESEGCSKEMGPVVSSNLLDPLYRLDTALHSSPPKRKYIHGEGDTVFLDVKRLTKIRQSLHLQENIVKKKFKIKQLQQHNRRFKIRLKYLNSLLKHVKIHF